MHLKTASKMLLTALAAGSFALSAVAQWQWIDKDGRKVFSDRSPPSDIKDKDILKRPPGAARVAEPAPVEDAGVAAASAPGAAAVPVAKASAPKLSGKDKELEAKKKQAELEEAGKKKADEEKVAKAKSENCDSAKRYMVSLQSGSRISGTNDKGEREVFDDAKRDAEKKRTQAAIDNNCK